MLLTCATFVLLRPPGPSAAALAAIENGEFESWSGPVPGGWVGENTASLQQIDRAGGHAVRGEAPATLRQHIEGLTPGASYELAYRATSFAAGASLDVEVGFFDDALHEAHSPSVDRFAPPPSGWTERKVTFVVPPGTAYVRLRIQFGDQGATGIDSLALGELAPPPTDTPTPTELPPTATPTPLVVPTVPGGVPGTSATPTRSPTPTRTPTRAASPTPVRTPTVRPTATPVLPGAVCSPAEPGELLGNGGFEALAGGAPACWSKFGGELRSDTTAYRGAYAALFDSSTTSTKWIYQVVLVDGGELYEASGMLRRAYGEGEVFLRVSWYLSPDGSGSLIDQHDSERSSASGWVALTTGEIRAPASARSARVRLMFQPAGFAGAAFDEVSFRAVETVEPAVERRVVLPALAADEARPSLLALGRQAPPAAPLRLSEFLSDPPEDGRDTPYEWVEIENVSPGPVDLAGWQVGDSLELDALPAAVVPPGGFVVVLAKDAPAPAGVLAVAVADGDIGRGLNNAGDVLRLAAPAGAVVDELSYGEDSSVSVPAPPAPGRGRTLGRTDDGPSAWRLTLAPTPGEANTFAPLPLPGGATAASGSPVAEAPVGLLDRPVLERSADGTSPIVWIALGACFGGGLVGLLVGARDHLPEVRRRFRK